jgi:hypothetical protein
MTVRNLVRTGVVGQLADSYRICLLAPFAADPAFRAEVGDERIALEELPYPVQLQGRLARLRLAVANRLLDSDRLAGRFARQHRLDTLRYRQYKALEELRSASPARWLAREVGAAAWPPPSSPGPRERWARRLRERAWAADRRIEALLDRRRPAALVCTHPFLPSEWPLLSRAHASGVPLVAVIHSWDNLTSRGELPVPFERVLVWSEHMRHDAVRLNPGLSLEDVVAVGSPQHDAFRDPALVRPRREFLAGLGLDPDRALVTFTGQGRAAPDEADVVSALADAVAGDRLGRPSQLWVRFYGDETCRARVSAVESRPNVYWEQAPGEFWGAFRLERSWNPGADPAHYINLLRHSDVVACSASTVSVDAAILDRPVVNACYDGRRQRDFFDSVKRLFFDREHYQRVIRSGGVELAFDDDELVAAVAAALRDPSRGAEGRRRLVHDICGPVDGQGRERMSAALLAALAAVSERRPS